MYAWVVFMYDVNGRELIQQIEESVKNQIPFMEIEINKRSQKLVMLCDHFAFPLSLVHDVSIIRSIYSTFSLIQIQNANHETIGMELLDSNQEHIQVSFYEETDNHSDVTMVNRFGIYNKNRQSILETRNSTNGNQNIFTINSDVADIPILEEISQKIDKVFHYESNCKKDRVKIYQIRRK